MEVYDLNGSPKGDMGQPEAFSSEARPELIRRAAAAETTSNLQPQGHFVLAGMQTTATYYGAMNEYRSGRHMGIAIRPREKLGGGRQGKVKRIPSAVKGKRAHPHMVEKILKENMNRREYQGAIMSSIAACSGSSTVVDDAIEGIARTREMVKVIGALKLGRQLEEGKKKRLGKGLRRGTRIRHYKRSLLVVVKEDKGAIRAARNIAGVDACTISGITVSALAPGGNPGRRVLWSESALKGVAEAVKRMSLGTQAKYARGLR